MKRVSVFEIRFCRKRMGKRGELSAHRALGNSEPVQKDWKVVNGICQKEYGTCTDATLGMEHPLLDTQMEIAESHA